MYALLCLAISFGHEVVIPLGYEKWHDLSYIQLPWHIFKHQLSSRDEYMAESTEETECAE